MERVYQKTEGVSNSHSVPSGSRVNFSTLSLSLSLSRSVALSPPHFPLSSLSLIVPPAPYHHDSIQRFLLFHLDERRGKCRRRGRGGRRK